MMEVNSRSGSRHVLMVWRFARGTKSCFEKPSDHLGNSQSFVRLRISSTMTKPLVSLTFNTLYLMLSYQQSFIRVRIGPVLLKHLMIFGFAHVAYIYRKVSFQTSSTSPFTQFSRDSTFSRTFSFFLNTHFRSSEAMKILYFILYSILIKFNGACNNH